MIGQGFYSPVSSLKSCKLILLIHKWFIPAIMARRLSTLGSDEMSLSKSATRITVLMSMFEKQLPSRTGSVYMKSVIGSLFYPACFIAVAALPYAFIM